MTLKAGVMLSNSALHCRNKLHFKIYSKRKLFTILTLRKQIAHKMDCQEGLSGIFADAMSSNISRPS